MNGKLAAGNLTTANVATSVYRCRTTGAAFISVSICNRSAETAEITLGVSDSANSSDVASIIEYKTELLPKNVLERTGVVVSSTQYLTVTSSVANVSVVATGVETGTFDDSIPEIPLIWSLSSTLDNPNAYDTSYNDRFGSSVAVSGDYAIVGAFFEDELGQTDAGKAYIYNAISGALLHTLDNPDDYAGSGGDNFGISVAISGNYAIVGAHQEDDAGVVSSGKAYIFNVTSGALVHTLDNPNAYGTSEDDYFGNSVAISSDYAVVGAKIEDDADVNNRSGKAYIFDVTTGSLFATLDNPNAYGTSTEDFFGLAAAISGNVVIISASESDEGYGSNGANSGKAYIYQLS